MELKPRPRVSDWNEGFVLVVVLVLADMFFLVVRLRVRGRDSFLIRVLDQPSGKFGGNFADVGQRRIDTTFTQVIFSYHLRQRLTWHSQHGGNMSIHTVIVLVGLWFDAPHNTEKVISETFFPANLLA